MIFATTSWYSVTEIVVFCIFYFVINTHDISCHKRKKWQLEHWKFYEDAMKASVIYINE